MSKCDKCGGSGQVADPMPDDVWVWRDKLGIHASTVGIGTAVRYVRVDTIGNNLAGWLADEVKHLLGENERLRKLCSVDWTCGGNAR